MNQKLHTSKNLVLLGLIAISLAACNRGGGVTDQAGPGTTPPPAQMAPEATPSTPSTPSTPPEDKDTKPGTTTTPPSGGSSGSSSGGTSSDSMGGSSSGGSR
jgi:hypothetical protein